MANSGVGQGLVVSFGEMLIDFVPTVSGVSLGEAPGFLKAAGGAPANVAIAISRLGGKAAFVGKLGDDEFGQMLAGILKENNVCAEGINFDKGARTALAFNFKGHVPGYAVKAVDTTGAGYSFVGALLAKIVDDLSIIQDEAKLKEVLKYACACGAITTTQKGAIPALPAPAAVLQLLKTGK
ncbi:hypothetical protein SASPL_101561 [Salvia splendens]|uniref:Carbohydrate kinase PfkB domain-containing protein n=1 Tax=Salvia splendens TaxID=180675 RepID=A0A8X8YS29_SALSN|nr:hypothetical protein SASPL_101561 [Salvia splendens]